MLQVARCKVVTHWGEGADVVKILCFLCLFNCKTSKSHALIEICCTTSVSLVLVLDSGPTSVCVHCISSAILNHLNHELSLAAASI